MDIDMNQFEKIKKQLEKKPKPLKKAMHKSQIKKLPKYPALKKLTDEEKTAIDNYSHLIENARGDEADKLLYALGEKIKSADSISGNYWTQNLDKIISRLAKIHRYHTTLNETEQKILEFEKSAKEKLKNVSSGEQNFEVLQAEIKKEQERLHRKRIREINLLRGTFRWVRREMKRIDVVLNDVKKDLESQITETKNAINNISKDNKKAISTANELEKGLERTKGLLKTFISIEQMLMLYDSWGGKIDKDINTLRSDANRKKYEKIDEDEQKLDNDLKKASECAVSLINFAKRLAPRGSMGKAIVILAMTFAAGGQVFAQAPMDTQHRSNPTTVATQSTVSVRVVPSPMNDQQRIDFLNLLSHNLKEEGAIFNNGWVYISVNADSSSQISRRQGREIPQIGTSLSKALRNNGVNVAFIQINGGTIARIGEKDGIAYYMMSENDFREFAQINVNN